MPNEYNFFLYFRKGVRFSFITFSSDSKVVMKLTGDRYLFVCCFFGVFVSWLVFCFYFLNLFLSSEIETSPY